MKRAFATRIVVAGLAVALVGAACSSGDDDDDAAGGDDDDTTETTVAAEEGEPVDGGEISYGIEAESDGLNPTANRFAVSGSLMGTAIFDTLAKFDTEGIAQPYLAESLTPSDDFMHWTIKLRAGVVFHDGTPLTSEAIQVGVEGQLADPLISIAVRPVLDEAEPVTIVDDLTATINTSRPLPYFPNYMTTQLGMIASPTWIQAAAADTSLNQEPVGTGPFMIDSRQLNIQTAVVKNPNYWQAGLPHLDAITFVVSTDPQARAQSFTAGDLDMIHTTSDESVVEFRENDDIQLFEDELGEETFVMLNTSKPPFDDIRARQVIAHATDREQMIDLLGSGILTIANSMFHPENRWYTPIDNFPAYDIAAAAAIAAAYCADVPDQCDGEKIKFEYKTTPNVDNDLIFQALSEMWGDVVTVTKVPVEQAAFITEAAVGNYNAVLWRQFGATDPDSDMLWLDSESIGAISVNWPRIDDPEIDGWLDEQRIGTDFEARRALWAQINEKLNEDLVYIWLNHTLWAVAAQDNIHGLQGQMFPDVEGEVEPFSNGRNEFVSMWVDG